MKNSSCTGHSIIFEVIFTQQYCLLEVLLSLLIFSLGDLDDNNGKHCHLDDNN